jgi:hypothetical protein
LNVVSPRTAKPRKRYAHAHSSTLADAGDVHVTSPHPYTRRVVLLQFYESNYFSVGGLIMMWAPGVPGNISHGPPGTGIVERPVDSGVAYGV